MARREKKRLEEGDGAAAVEAAVEPENNAGEAAVASAVGSN